jgi:hypothetical protein
VAGEGPEEGGPLIGGMHRRAAARLRPGSVSGVGRPAPATDRLGRVLVI